MLLTGRLFFVSALAALSLLGSGMWGPSHASAQAKVSVELKSATGEPADGEVSLHKKTGELVASCKTSSGHCEMTEVAGGMYEVRVAPATGSAPKPRSVMIPPEGVAKLIVSTAS
jgi:hypothetical protein